jgi:hypothetical protein
MQVLKQVTLRWIRFINIWEYKNEIGHDGFNHPSLLLPGDKFYFISGQQIDFQKGRTLPAPYLFQCNMGYLGSPLMTWFFVRLKDKKKIFFLEQKSQNYDFASERKNQERIDSLKPLYYTFLAGFFCCFLLAFIAILIRLNVV